ncbi:MAG: phenylalanine--tRNA ligase subunit beta, partial [Candidatus Omnitrophica bacterium]|nr:phenylalanine--tRNA ligase subunit beta [Candidatus Omnitrophota bacterium]
EPLHAFDLDKLSQKQDVLEIIVRRAKAGEKIITIDGKNRELDKDILVIADSQKPVAIAGIVGGKDTEVSESTKNILLEAAKFSAGLIRRGRQKLGISTESSYRFERDIDIDSLNFASLRAQELILKEAKGRPVLFAVSRRLKAAQPKTIVLKKQKLDAILGMTIPGLKIKSILEHLGLKAKITKTTINACIPAFRRDLNKDIDLAEEVCRIYGYARIPVTMPSIIAQEIEPGVYDFNLMLRDILVSQGLYEVITHSLVNAEFLKKNLIEEEGISLENPLSKELEVLRPTLMPSLLNCMAYNFNRKIELVRIFEIAKKFTLDEPENYLLTIGLAGARTICNLSGKAQEKMSILHLKGILEVLLERLGINNFEFSAAAHSAFKDGACFNLVIQAKACGIIGEVKQAALDAADIKGQKAFLAELYLPDIYKFISLDRRYKRLPAYPAISRDISIVVAGDVAVKDLISLIKTEGKPFIKEVKVADLYTGEHIPEGCKGLTFSCVYQSAERTLEDAEVNCAQQKILENLKKQFNAQLR